MRSIQVEVPNFNVSLDLIVYLDWEAGMNHCFAWYEMIDTRKVRFAQIRLMGRAKNYWASVERLLEQRRQEPIMT